MSEKMKSIELSPATISLRKSPKNITESDKKLFEHEYEKEIIATQVVEFEDVFYKNKVFFSKFDFIQEISDLYHYYGNPQGYQYKHHFTTIEKIKFLLKNHFFAPKKTLNEAYWVEDNWSIGGYFHWITDVLTRIIAVTEKDKDAVIVLSSTGKKISFIIQSLAELNLKVLFLDDEFTWKINKFHFVCPTASTGNYNEEIINLLREKIRNSISLENTNPTRRIYISRKKAPRRFIVNEEEVEKLLAKYDFECLCFEDFSWEEQVRISMNTEILVSLHGAGLTNMIAMPPNSNIVELRKEEDKQNNCYFSLASALKINYYYQLCDTDNQLASTQDANFVVDLEELDFILKDIVNSL
jgi:hypothetical protein